MSSEQILNFLTKQLQAGEAAEIYFESRDRLAIQSKDQQVDALQQAKEEGVGLRVECEGRLGFAYSSDLAEAALLQLVQRAYDSANVVEPLETESLPDLQDLPVSATAEFDESLVTRPIEQKIEAARSLERAARAVDSRVQQVRQSTYEEETQHVTLWNSRGGSRSFARTLCQAHLMVIAGDASGQEAAWDMDFAPRFEDLDCEAIAEEAAREALGRLGGTKLTTGSYPALLHRSVVATFLGILAPSFLGESVQRNKSALAGRLNESIYSDAVTVIDDGAFVGGIVSAPFDGEGVPSQRTTLVAQGVLQNFLYDVASAKPDGRASTGNSQRASFKSAPQPGTSNLYIEAGTETLEEMPQGIAIHDVIGMHTANPITGDFSVGASGYLIEQGQRVSPVRGFAISGNLHHILNSVDAVGSDLKFYGKVGAPSLRVRQLTVSGV